MCKTYNTSFSMSLKPFHCTSNQTLRIWGGCISPLHYTLESTLVMIHKYVVKGQGGTEPTNWSLGYYNKNGLNCFALFCWSNRTILFWIISISLRDTLFLYACFTFIATLCKLQKHWNHFHRFLVSTYFYFDFLRWRIHTTTDQWSNLFYRDGT